jgi:hypothetical protein
MINDTNPRFSGVISEEFHKSLPQLALVAVDRADGDTQLRSNRFRRIAPPPSVPACDAGSRATGRETARNPRGQSPAPSAWARWRAVAVAGRGSRVPVAGVVAASAGVRARHSASAIVAGAYRASPRRAGKCLCACDSAGRPLRRSRARRLGSAPDASTVSKCSLGYRWASCPPTGIDIANELPRLPYRTQSKLPNRFTNQK